MRMIMNEVDQLFSELSYEERCNFYNKHFSSGASSTCRIKDKLILIALICFVTHKLREKDGSLTVKSVIEKIVNKPIMELNGFEDFLLGLSVVCEDMLYGCTEFETFGLKTSQEIIDKIRALLNEWMPF